LTLACAWCNFGYKYQINTTMKRILFLIAIICSLTVNAQNYLITFAGTGASNNVDSVKVENLM